MGRLIKKLLDGSSLAYDDGRFDSWCIYHVRPHEPPLAVKDIEIFDQLEKLSRKIGAIQLYRDFLSIYQQTNRNISSEVLQHITELACNYSECEELLDFILTVLYAGMVAEENKEGTILRKRIKRLGVHQLLVEERPAQYAANFSRGKPWRELVIECEVRGF